MTCTMTLLRGCAAPGELPHAAITTTRDSHLMDGTHLRRGLLAGDDLDARLVH